MAGGGFVSWAEYYLWFLGGMLLMALVCAAVERRGGAA
jgi:hypothetical protein